MNERLRFVLSGNGYKTAWGKFSLVKERGAHTAGPRSDQDDFCRDQEEGVQREEEHHNQREPREALAVSKPGDDAQRDKTACPWTKRQKRGGGDDLYYYSLGDKRDSCGFEDRKVAG